MTLSTGQPKGATLPPYAALVPYYIKPLALYQRRLGCWTVYDRYHRIPLYPVMARTIEGVTAVAASMLEGYIKNPIVGQDGDWISSLACNEGPLHAPCPHGLPAAMFDRVGEL